MGQLLLLLFCCSGCCAACCFGCRRAKPQGLLPLGLLVLLLLLLALAGWNACCAAVLCCLAASWNVCCSCSQSGEASSAATAWFTSCAAEATLSACCVCGCCRTAASCNVSCCCCCWRRLEAAAAAVLPLPRLDVGLEFRYTQVLWCHTVPLVCKHCMTGMYATTTAWVQGNCGKIVRRAPKRDASTDFQERLIVHRRICSSKVRQAKAPAGVPSKCLLQLCCSCLIAKKSLGNMLSVLILTMSDPSSAVYASSKHCELWL